MNYKLPLLYRWTRAHGLTGLTPWHFIDIKSEAERIQALQREYALETGSTRIILPFAARQDMDTIAAFVMEGPHVKDEVVTVHLTWTQKQERPGWPEETSSTSFQQWMSDVLVPDAADWMSEEDLPVSPEKSG